MRQYHHQRPLRFDMKPEARGGTTFFVEVPPKSIMETLLKVSNPVIWLGFGKADCHPKDNYDKRVGRTLALSRAKTHPFTLFSIYLHEGKNEYRLRNDDGAIIVLETSHNSEKVFFIDAD